MNARGICLFGSGLLKESSKNYQGDTTFYKNLVYENIKALNGPKIKNIRGTIRPLLFFVGASHF